MITPESSETSVPDGRAKSMPSTVPLLPVVSCIQRMALYETASWYYLVGSNNTQTKFRVLKIDRSDPYELTVIDDKVEYNRDDIGDFLAMIGKKDKQMRTGQKPGVGLNRALSGFGIVGFVSFRQGYYLILITKRRRIAIIGHHTIYKVEDTNMVYLPNTPDSSLHPEESRYVKTFQNVDLSSNFYFSYSYDLTHTLQYNVTPLRCFTAAEKMTASNCNVKFSEEESEIEELDAWDILPVDNSVRPPYKMPGKRLSHIGGDNVTEDRAKILVGNVPGGECFAGRTKPNWRYVWNSYLLEPVELHSDWLLYITHGFVGQTNISVYGHPIYLTLIARRSQKFSGTRFLKRGANCEGDVANEVENEQIVHDSSVSSFTRGNFTSFVQVRGSIPFSWSQDMSKMVPKPAINLDLLDPYCYAAGRHFNLLLRQYGAPVIALNLVKKREKRPHECLLSEQFIAIIDYLNQFLPRAHHIEHIAFDMARNNKMKKSNVMDKLSDISYYILHKTGIFHTRGRQCPPPPHYSLGGKMTLQGARLQTGVARVNCVDCLDRTNTAQFALGKCALAFQLNALGVIPKPDLVFDTDTVRMLEVLYEDHGDTLALQYGGSQLVHRVKTYRKIAPLSSHSRDIMQTLSRYYSNTFSDADKQNAINLFLGVYRPSQHTTPLWDMNTDYYLHNPVPAGKLRCHRNPYTCWYDEDVVISLPFAAEEVLKCQGKTLMEVMKLEVTNEKVDGFLELYRPFEISVLNELFMFSISHSVRDIMPNSAVDYSPFSVRIRPGKHTEKAGMNKPTNPSVTGIWSTTSTSSGGSDSESDSDSDEDPIYAVDSDQSSSNDLSQKAATFESLFRTMKQTYGVEIHNPSPSDLTTYKRFVTLGRLSGMSTRNDASSIAAPKRSVHLIHQSAFPIDSVYEVTPPTVTRVARDIYHMYVQRGKTGATAPLQQCLVAYQRFIGSKYQ
ncbi:polyphosphoinositide phosphatase-like [Ornithodoros turicata]|uniref:polyphosphoinositide phosphatase-like n=1 Tax=Ornithodoros turicata TaxID=34597 RepID=UPI003138DB29